MAKGNPSGKCKKADRNKKKCDRYKAQDRRVVNKLKKAEKMQKELKKGKPQKLNNVSPPQPMQNIYKPFRVVLGSSPTVVDLNPNTAWVPLTAGPPDYPKINPKRRWLSTEFLTLRTIIVEATDANWAKKRAYMAKEHYEQVRSVELV